MAFPAQTPVVVRAKALPIDDRHVSRLRSSARQRGRDRRVEIVGEAMRASRATPLDVADALELSERAARRAVEGGAPVDVGDLFPIAESGPGGLRLARRIVAALTVELDRI
jgi:hypothetical protein